MIIYRRLFCVLFLAGLLLAGCATGGKPVDPNDESRSLVFGYVDMKDAPSKLQWVSIRQYGGKPQYFSAGTKNGIFWHIGLEPGSYQVERFGGMGGIPFFSPTEYQYNFGTRGRNETAIRIKQPGIYFMGAYKYIDHDGGFFRPDKFEMQAVKKPNEKELLQKLINILESDKKLRIYTRQITLAKKRLSTLQ